VRFLLGTVAYARHVQHMALALHEAGALGAYHAASVDHYRSPAGRRARQVIARRLPRLDRELRRRRIGTVPEDLVVAHLGADLARTLAGRLRLGERLVDWLWERGEHALDRRCARLLATSAFDAFLGVEHGALATLEAARRLGKPGVVAFLSPHHATRARLVDAEYARFPELATSATRRLLELGRRRDARRDAEAAAADVVLANSEFTRRSLAAAGIPASRIVSVPLGSPPALPDEALPARPPAAVSLIYAGPVSVRKGAHHLLEAWRRLPARHGARLDLYGVPLLPRRCLDGLPDDVRLHGSVPHGELQGAYRQAAALVFPTLCDGFGEVVTEALAAGLPVITTRHAGAAELIEEGRSGFLVEPGEPGALTDRLAWCLEHPAELHAMRPAALAAARAWTWADFRAALRERLGRALGVDLSARLPGVAEPVRP
jgi:glycosyltransferase involved in cell wall biosynthesis